MKRFLLVVGLWLVTASVNAQEFSVGQRRAILQMISQFLTYGSAVAPVFCSDAGASDTYTCSPSPAITSYVDGLLVHFRPNTNNTGEASLNINSLGAVTIKQGDGSSSLTDDQLVAGSRYVLSYDGTNFRLVSGAVTASTSASSVTFDAAGEIASTDVQAAIEEVDSEKLPLAGGTMTGQVITSSHGVEFTESDTNPTCGAGNFTIFADTSENKLKKCQNGSASDLDTTGAGISTIDEAFDGGKEIDGADSLANALRIGDGVTPWCIYTDASAGPIITPCTDANVTTRVPADFTWALYDAEADDPILTVDPDAATINAMYQFGANYRPKGSIWFGAGAVSTDGTNCAAPSERTINSGPILWTVRCADAAGVIHGGIRMPVSYDGGTVTFGITVTHGTTENIGTDGDVSMSCRADSDTINSTYGTAIALDVDVTTANDVEIATSAAVTGNGSCAGGNWLYWKWVKDAGGSDANSANTDILGFTLTYSKSSLSD